jgi:crotonobetainyl-CoA:carnitine CoA-transferase CaiB-like acyl-CoA transferase
VVGKLCSLLRATSLAVPYCTQILAALGADVIKVEHPARGDEARAWGPPFAGGGSVMFFVANAGKRSLALDLSTPAGREALLRLAERSAVFVQSLRPGAAERLGLGPADLHARNDGLIYCSIGAFGRHGPLADDPGYDPLMQAAGGIMSVTGEPGGARVRVGTSLIDLGTAVWTALAVLAALLEAGGRVLDVSLYETTLALLPYQLTNYLATGVIADREGSAFPLIAPYQDGPRRERPAFSRAVQGGRAPKPCRRRALCDKPAPGCQPRPADPIARAAFSDADVTELAAAGVTRLEDRSPS